MNKNKALLLIDCQNDFINGSLAVNGAIDIMDALTRFVEKHASDYNHIHITCDWHPSNHISFSENGGQWPLHCVKHTVGAAIYPPLMNAIIKSQIPYTIYTKGEKFNKEEYSFIQNSRNSFLFNLSLKEDSIHQIDCAGICGDICVMNSIQDMMDNLHLNDQINVLSDFCPCIDNEKFITFLEKNFKK